MKIGNKPIDSAYANGIKPIRNKMRKYSYLSMLYALLSYLNNDGDEEKLVNLQKLPWVVERMLIWLLADNQTFYGRLNVEQQALNEMINSAWNIVSGISAKNINKHHFTLVMRQLFLSQITHQTSNSHALIMQLYLAKRLDKKSNLKRYLDIRARMPIEKYLSLAILFWSKSLESQAWFSFEYLHKLAKEIPQLLTFVDCVSYGLKDAQEDIRATRVVALDEWFQPSILYSKPFLTYEKAIVPLSKPTVRRFFENVIGDWLDQENGGLKQDYEKVLEHYVEEALTRASVSFLNEEEIKKLDGFLEGQKVCDFLIEESDGYILLEVKNKALTNRVPSGTDINSLRTRLNSNVLKGNGQLKETEESCKKIPRFKNKACYKLVVTTGDLYIKSVESIFDSGQHYSDESIWLSSIRDLDDLAELVSKSKTTFCEFFADFRKRNLSPETSLFTLGMLLEKEPYCVMGLPQHLLNELDAVSYDLKQNLTRL